MECDIEMNKKTLPCLIVLCLIFSACSAAQSADAAPTTTVPVSPTLAATATQRLPTSTTAPTLTPTSTTTPTPEASGPTNYPPGVNPLTGLPVADPSLLELPPLLVSTSNTPVTARPQRGLSYSPLVFEMYIGEGASRFLAVYYGTLPVAGEGDDDASTSLGPIRSGRLPYEKLRLLYRGHTVFASASPRVLDKLEEYTIVRNADLENINGASLPIAEIPEIMRDTQTRMGKPAYSGLRFDPIPPAGGEKARQLWVGFHRGDQIFWRYDEQQGSYHRYQDMGEGTPLEVFTDRLNGETLSYENVIVMFVNYRRFDETLFNIDLMYITRMPALLFRDGKMYEIYWTTRNEAYELKTGNLRPIRFVDYDGNPIPLKPGQTWIEMVQLYNPYFETGNSEKWEEIVKTQKPGSGNWAVQFIPPDFDPANFE